MSARRVFDNAEQVRIAYQGYIKSLEGQGFPKQTINPKTGEVVSLITPCPPTFEGFSLFAGCNNTTFSRYVAWYEMEINPYTNKPFDENEREIIDEIHNVYTAIKGNHMAGSINQVYNGGFVARLHRMADTQDVNLTGQSQQINISINGDDLKLK